MRRISTNGSEDAALSPTGPRSHLAIAAIALLAAVLTIHRLDAADVCGDNEAFEGVFVQQMVERGEILFPLLNGRVPMYKPPLFHWTAAALDHLLGMREVTAFNLRLPSALYATGGAALTMAFVLGTIGEGAAIVSGLILAGSYQYISQGRIGRVDMTLTFFETLALFSFLWWHVARAGADEKGTRTEPDDAMLYLLAMALGLGVLAKGPIGAILPIAAIAVFLVAEHRASELAAMIRPGPALVAIAIGSSWYVACLFGRRYGFLSRQLGSENFGRFFGSLGAMAPWYYVEPILLNSAPLSIFVPIAVVAAVRSDSAVATAAGKEKIAGGPARSGVRLLAIFWLVTVGFFTLAAYKRRAYLLPLWPASAVMLAWWIETMRPRRFGWLARPAAGAICAALIVFNFTWLPRSEIRNCGGDSYRLPAAQIARVVGPEEPLFVFGIEGDLAPLLFYLDRDVTPLSGKLGDAPPGYVIVPAEVWSRARAEAPGLEPVLTANSGRIRLILLRRGKVYAGNRHRPGHFPFVQSSPTLGG
jgi:4-amino-4-deoxy-L-arabinose transferase-like glycosyltransferase